MASGGTCYLHVRELAVYSSLSVVGTAAAAWLVGLLIGRHRARAVVTLLIPPKPRLMLAFLWHADGKALPVPAGQPQGR